MGEESKTSVRVMKLEKAMDMALDAAMRACPVEEFLNCFPTLKANHTNVLKSLYTQFVSLFATNVKSEFRLICEESNIIDKLIRLDDLIEESKKKKKSTDDPSDVYPIESYHEAKALIRRLKVMELQRAKKELEELNSENAKLKAVHDALASNIKTNITLINDQLSPMTPILTHCREYDAKTNNRNDDDDDDDS